MRSARLIVTGLALLGASLLSPAAAAAEPLPQSSTRIGVGIKVESTGGCLLGLPIEGANGTICYVIHG
jgi:hypothetical protein